jgi:hypothetical protein
VAVEFYGDLSDPMAIVIRSAEKVAGIDFFSPANFSQQILVLLHRGQRDLEQL